MILEKERKLIVEYGRKMIATGLTRGTGGNVSIYNRSENMVAVSPSALAYGETRAEDIVIVDLKRCVIEGSRKPSSELSMHLMIYNNRLDISAVIHTHSIYAATLSCLQWEIPAVHYLIGFAGGPIRCAPYATVTTDDLAHKAHIAMKGRKAVLLSNHGLLAGGETIDEAFAIAETAEYCAEVYYKARCAGKPKEIPEIQLQALLEKFEEYGH